MLLISSRNAPPTAPRATGRQINLHTNLQTFVIVHSDGPGQDRGGKGEAPAGDVRRARGGEQDRPQWLAEEEASDMVPLTSVSQTHTSLATRRCGYAGGSGPSQLTVDPSQLSGENRPGRRIFSFPNTCTAVC